MSLFIILILVFLVFYFFFVRNKRFEVEHVDLDNIEIQSGHFPYVKRNYLMTKAEFNFFKVLEQITHDKYYVIPQVALSKLVSVKSGESLWKTYNNKIDRKSVDFVLFSKPYFSPALIIELDDRTHDRYDRKLRDGTVDKIAHEAGIKIVHIKNSYSYDLNQTQSLIDILGK